MKKYTLKISSKGQIAIPKKIRDQLGSELLELEYKSNKIILTPPESIESLGGSLKKYAKNKKEPKTEEDITAWGKHVEEKFGDS